MNSNDPHAISGRCLFVFSDPGGAKPLLAWAQSVRHSVTVRVISDRNYNFQSDFDVEVLKPQHSAHEEIKAFRPDFVLTGTSYTSSLEREFIAAALKAKIHVYSFVDHWTDIRGRFLAEEGLLLPDKIMLVDERAKQLALDAGLPESNLLVSGNPYHDYLKTWVPQMSKKELFASIGQPVPDRKIVLYAPDPLSNVNGSIKFGFDEIAATKAMLTSLSGCQGDFFFILNPHPNQNMSRLIPEIPETMLVAPPGLHLNSLIYYSDIVIGFFSNFLIESGIMGKPVYRFFASKEHKDPLAGMGIGEKVYPETICNALRKI